MSPKEFVSTNAVEADTATSLGWSICTTDLTGAVQLSPGPPSFESATFAMAAAAIPKEAMIVPHIELFMINLLHADESKAGNPAKLYLTNKPRFQKSELPESSLAFSFVSKSAILLQSLAGFQKPVIIAGAVDVSSGVEDAPGVKSAEKIARFCVAVRAADAAC